jgi:hypothetical protein
MSTGIDGASCGSLHDLLSALCDGVASPEQMDRIEDLLRRDPAARRFYLRYMDLHARMMQHPALRHVQSEDRGTRARMMNVECRKPNVESLDVRHSAFDIRHSTIRVQVAASALALLLLVGTATVVYWHSVRSEDQLGYPLAGHEAVASWPTAGSREPGAGVRRAPPSLLPAVPAARLTAVDCQWVNPESALRQGESLPAGRRLELASGQVEVVFRSGAKVNIHGPAIFEVQSDNSGFLTLGRLTARADTPQSRGFTVHSRTAATVDLGTEFTVVAAQDGHSQIHVVEGAVEVRLSNGKAQRRLGVGQSIEVEPGSPSVIARIEPGEGTAAFKFPTIEPPTSHDYADASKGLARIRVVRGRAHYDSGPVEILLDGKGQPKSDAPRESFFFNLNESGMILLDLGQKISVKKVNTYSWHQRHDLPRDRTRATQKYYLYGSARPEAPAAGANPAAAGWTLIAQVNTDEFFGFPRATARPEQQAVSITATNGGPIGGFRYLLWDIRPTRADESAVAYDNTFYGEFDVYKEEQ